MTCLAGLLAAGLIAISGCTATPTNTPTLTAEPTVASAASATALTATPTNTPTLTAEPTVASAALVTAPTAKDCLYVYLQDVSRNLYT